MSIRPDFGALRDLDVFVKLGESERLQLAEAVAEALGEGWKSIESSSVDLIDALRLSHERTGLVFHLVPGGVFRMGLSAEDVTTFELALESAAAVKSILERFEKILRPVRSVTVAPFLVTPWSIPYDVVRRLSNGRYRGDTFGRAAARDLAHSAGFRLPSEAEHEWLARDGGRFAFTLDCVACARAKRQPRSRFGIENLHFEQWADDDWHLTYKGAPTNSESWMNGDPRGVYRGGLLLNAVQSDEEYLFGLAALRFPGPKKGGVANETSESSDDSLDGIEEDAEPDGLARFACSLPVSLTS
jgi:hypothetical protein